MIWITLGQSWNLVLGYGGVWNFGQLAFYASARTPRRCCRCTPGLTALARHPGRPDRVGHLAVLPAPVLQLRGIYVSLLLASPGRAPSDRR